MAQTLNVIDISKWQDPEALDWQAIVDAGVKAVIIQLSHGLEYEDKAKEHIAKAEQYGLIWHGYHYYQGNAGEVEFSVSNAKSLGLADNAYMFWDVEGDIGGDWQAQFYDFRAAWLQANWNVGLYLSAYPYSQRFDNTQIVNDGVYRWIASYGTEPANYDIWQMSGEGGGGIGSYVKDIDKDYDKVGALLKDYVVPIDPVEPAPYDPDTPEDGAKVGFGVDSSGLGGGRSFGYSTDGKNFYAAITPYGHIFRQGDGDRMWKLIEPYIKYPDTSTFITNDTMSNYVLTQLKSYAKIDQIPDLTDYAKLEDIPEIDLSDYVKTEQLANYAKASDIPDTSLFITKTALIPYALKTDVPDVSAFITNESLKPYATSKYVLTQLKSYALVNDIPDVSSFITSEALTPYALKTDIPSLTDYARLEDIPDLSPYAKTADIAKTYATIASLTAYGKVKTVNSITPDSAGNVAISIPSLTGYAKLTDIPSLATYATQSWVSQQGYAKQASLSNYVLSTDLTTQLNDISVGGTNLIVHNGETKDKYLDQTGAVASSSNSANLMTDYISVAAGEKLTFHKDSGSQYYWRWNWYDADKKYISRKADQSDLFIWTVPANTHYLWVSYPNIGNMKLERGTMATDWSPAPKDKADDSAVVHQTGDETITGTKSFTGTINVNASALSTTNGFQKLIQAASMTDGGYVAVGNAGSDVGYVELGTIDDGNTTVYVRKRNGSNAILAEAKLLDSGNNTSFPGTVSSNGKVLATQDYVSGGYQVKRIVDTRKANNNPSWYIDNHPQESWREFKNASDVGITTAMLPPGISLGFVSLTTDTPWNTSSGGYPTQIARFTQSSRPVELHRVGISDTAWSTWELITSW